MRLLAVSLFAATALVLTPGAASAGGCPTGFHLHAVGEGDHDGEHRHVGLSMDAVDRNGNGLICVKHVTPAGDIHVHIDDRP
jgi:hypothetical protein